MPAPATPGLLTELQEMAKKKAPAQELPLEQQPLFLKTLEFLPVERVELEQLAGQMLALFNDAMLTASVRDIETSALRYSAVVYRLNGDTFLGSSTREGSGGQLRKLLAAPAGVVPGWGQAGEYLLEVGDMRLRVEVDPWGVNKTHSLSFHAVDASAKFLSETGYLSQFLHPDKYVGSALGQAVRALVEGLVLGEFKPKSIREDERNKITVPAWLAPALQGVTHNGQLNMPLSGEAGLPGPVEKAPMSNAERQRRHRQRLKELADTEGLKVIPLTHMERCVLSLGLLAHEDLDHRPKDWATTKKPGFDALLTKLWPEGDNGRYLAEPERSTRRPAAFLRDDLERSRTENLRLKAALNEIAVEVGAPTATPGEGSLLGKALDAGERYDEVAFLLRELDKAKTEIGALSDSLKAQAPSDVEARLRAEIVGLQRQNALEIADRGKAFDAVAVLQERLKKAGLVFDYRKQPGE